MVDRAATSTARRAVMWRRRLGLDIIRRWEVLREDSVELRLQLWSIRLENGERLKREYGRDNSNFQCHGKGGGDTFLHQLPVCGGGSKFLHRENEKLNHCERHCWVAFHRFHLWTTTKHACFSKNKQRAESKCTAYHQQNGRLDTHDVVSGLEVQEIEEHSELDAC